MPNDLKRFTPSDTLALVMQKVEVERNELTAKGIDPKGKVFICSDDIDVILTGLWALTNEGQGYTRTRRESFGRGPIPRLTRPCPNAEGERARCSDTDCGCWKVAKVEQSSCQVCGGDMLGEDRLCGICILETERQRVRETDMNVSICGDPTCAGWDIFHARRVDGTNGLQIERCDSCGRYDDDDDAVKRVIELVDC